MERIAQIIAQSPLENVIGRNFYQAFDEGGQFDFASEFPVEKYFRKGSEKDFLVNY